MAKRKGINWDEQPLGRLNDDTIARKLGVSRTTVREARLHRGIGQAIRTYNRGIGAKILAILADGKCYSVKDLSERLDSVETWVRSKTNQLVAAGKVEKHAVGWPKRNVYSLPGVKYVKPSAFTGNAAPTMKATEAERAFSQMQEIGDDLLEPGSFSFIEYDTEDRSDAFYCKRKRKKVTLQHCVTLFGEIHAYERKGEKCYKCEQGAAHRLKHCYELEPTPAFINDVLKVATGGSSASEARLCYAMEAKKR
jgi:DNA-binding Lrp family transcriptional regulator